MTANTLRLIFFSTVCLTLSIPAIGQQNFQKRLYQENRLLLPKALYTPSTGQIIISGETYDRSNLDHDFFLVVSEEDGRISLAKRFTEGEFDEAGASVIRDMDGNYVMAGNQITGPKSSSILLVKTNPNGEVLWSGSLGGKNIEKAAKVIQAKDGGYLVTGSTTSYGSGNGADIYLVKFTNDGKVAWAKTYGFYGTYSEGYDVLNLPDGGYIVTGTSFLNNIDQGFLLKLNDTGEQQWNKYFFLPGQDLFIRNLTHGGNGTFVLSGWLTNPTDKSQQAVLLKTTAEGGLDWAYAFNGPQQAFPYQVLMDKDGDYVVSGYFNKGGGNADAFVLKTSSNGTLRWSKSYGDEEGQFIYAASQSSKSGLYLTGKYQSSATKGHRDIYLASIGKDGASDCHTESLPVTPVALKLVSSSISFMQDEGYILNRPEITVKALQLGTASLCPAVASTPPDPAQPDPVVVPVDTPKTTPTPVVIQEDTIPTTPPTDNKAPVIADVPVPEPIDSPAISTPADEPADTIATSASPTPEPEKDLIIADIQQPKDTLPSQPLPDPTPVSEPIVEVADTLPTPIDTVAELPAEPIPTETEDTIAEIKVATPEPAPPKEDTVASKPVVQIDTLIIPIESPKDNPPAEPVVQDTPPDSNLIAMADTQTPKDHAPQEPEDTNLSETPTDQEAPTVATTPTDEPPVDPVATKPEEEEPDPTPDPTPAPVPAKDIPPAVAEIAFSGKPCLGGSLTFEDKEAMNNVVWRWNFGDGASGEQNTAQGSAASHEYTKAGNFTVSLTAISTYGDSITVTTPIIIHPLPEVATTPPDTSICEGATATLSLTGSGNAKSYYWVADQPNATDTIRKGPNTTLEVEAPSRMTLWGVSDKGCENAASFKIPVKQSPRPEVRMIPGDNQCYPRDVLFDFTRPVVPMIHEVLWDLGDGNKIPNPDPYPFIYTYEPNPDTTYPITYKAHFMIEYVNGCKRDSIIPVEVCEGFYAPGNFILGDDSIPNRYVMTGIDFDACTFMVFNQMGDKVYEEQNYKNNWTGKGNNRKLLNSGIYYFALSCDGDNFTGWVQISKD